MLRIRNGANDGRTAADLRRHGDVRDAEAEEERGRCTTLVESRHAGDTARA
jgi:hypothetical protein